MQVFHIPFWKSSPFFRLLVPLIVGIMLQWYLKITPGFILICFSCFLVAILLFKLLNTGTRYKLRLFQGILFNLVIALFSMFLTWQKETRHDGKWYGHHDLNECSFLLRIDEPLVEKEKSVKAVGYVEAVIINKVVNPAKGKIYLYFLKDRSAGLLHYGDRVLISKPVQPIKNSGNPGCFDYEKFAAFQQVYHQVFLKPGEWVLFDKGHTNRFRSFIFSIQQQVVSRLKKYIVGGQHEKGIAEALLIGYKADLDKDLVQAYSNTGVVHIIAISGLHLGLIYILLSWILDRMRFTMKFKLLRVILLLGFLWLFSILTGASASVLRSAVMFSFIVIGKNYFRQPGILNSLAGSAFFLLCYDPFFLWDLGFQLSYLAIIGIVTIQQPLYKLFYIKQKWLDKIWNMLSVTLAAQVTTFPACIYYFHQFPNLFFITNLVAVPLSTVILFAELFLIAISWWPAAAIITGKVTSVLISLMNRIITSINGISFSVWEGIQTDLLCTWMLYLLIISSSYWLIFKNKKAFRVALFSMLIIAADQSFTAFKTSKQAKMIIYNIPKCRAIDFIRKKEYVFYGDSLLIKNEDLINIHIKPSRTLFHLEKQKSVLPNLYVKENFFTFYRKKILVIDSAMSFKELPVKQDIDVLLISGNPALGISGITNAIRPSIVVFDASNSLWKIAKWKKECIALALPCFSIPGQGAFVLDIDQQWIH